MIVINLGAMHDDALKGSESWGGPNSNVIPGSPKVKLARGTNSSCVELARMEFDMGRIEPTISVSIRARLFQEYLVRVPTVICGFPAIQRPRFGIFSGLKPCGAAARAGLLFTPK
jgi:hypothetical protein